MEACTQSQVLPGQIFRVMLSSGDHSYWVVLTRLREGKRTYHCSECIRLPGGRGNWTEVGSFATMWHDPDPARIIERLEPREYNLARMDERAEAHRLAQA